jgi:hypothetical protein
MPKLRSISNKIRSLGYAVRGWKRTVAWLSGAQWATFAARFGQIAIETQLVIFLAVDEAIDRLFTDANTTEAIRQQASGNLLWRPASLQLVDDLGPQSRIAPQLSQPASPLPGDTVSNRALVAVVVRQFAITKRIALDLAVDRRAMTPKLVRHLVNWNSCRHQMVKASAIGEGDLRIASRHAKISKTSH